MKLNAQQLRQLTDKKTITPIKYNPLYLILDTIYDTYNIGGLFRLADALAMEKIYLCGETETPPNHKIKKASIGTDKIVPWEYAHTTIEVIEKLTMKNEKIQSAISIVAIEQDKNATPYTQVEYQLPLALIVGNETTGISETVLKQSDMIVEIPMYGINTSLNVIVSAAIVGYYIISKINASAKH